MNENRPPHMKPLVKVNLACGPFGAGRPGWLGLDKAALANVDIVHDLKALPWPFADGEVGEAVCGHFFEHLTGPERIAFMDELYRVLAPGAEVLFIVPWWASKHAIRDPLHQWPPICEESFWYFNKAWRRSTGVDHCYGTCDFELMKWVLVLEDEWFRVEGHGVGKTEAERAYAGRHLLNAGVELQMTLRKL